MKFNISKVVLIIGAVLLVLAIALAGFSVGVALSDKKPSANVVPSPGPTPALNATSTSLLKPTNPAATTQAPLYGVVISSGLNLRQSPTTEAPVAGTLAYSEIITLTRREGSWYQTSEGLWVSVFYLEVRQTRAEAESYKREINGK